MQLNLVEKVKIIGKLGELKVEAKIDTGAKRTSIDKTLAKHLGLVPLAKRGVKVKSGSVKKPIKRKLVNATVELKRKKHKVKASIEDRSHMKYSVIIGMDIIKHYKFILIPKRG